MNFEQVRDVIVETLNCDTASVTPTARLREDLGADSLDIVDLSMALEEVFGVDELTEDEISGITTVGDLVRFLQSRLD